MTQFEPKFTLTPLIEGLCSELWETCRLLEGKKLPLPRLKLRKYHSLKSYNPDTGDPSPIKGLETFAQIQGKWLMGSTREITELRNAVEAYQKIPYLDIYSLNDYCRMHLLLLSGLLPEAGIMRTRSVSLSDGQTVARVAPAPDRVPSHMVNLFEFLRDNTRYHPLIKAVVFHYESLFAHPFTDGNGRISRFWEDAICIHLHPSFQVVSVEMLVRQTQNDYYPLLDQCQKKGSSEAFIEYILKIRLEALKLFL